MSELRKRIEEERVDLKERFESQIKRLDQLEEKYGDIDFGNYLNFVSMNEIVVSVHEEYHKEAIAHFRKQFPKKADIRVSAIGKDSFYVRAYFGDDFNLFWDTKTPEKYLPKGCRVERKTEETTRIVCDMEV